MIEQIHKKKGQKYNKKKMMIHNVNNLLVIKYLLVIVSVYQ